MAIIKCKMCGGELEIQANSTVAECEYCGSRQTVPTADNEKKLALFTRANKLRASCEFDKAAGVYESIIADFPSEAEAYWGLVLCKYGIEYVDDPATGKKVPTCHRSSFDSIFDDPDFEQALENADVVARKVYRDEAKTIEEIRKGIIDVSGKEQPYDIFICYKETDENGERTVDSVIAQDVYDELTKKKYHVFFSRITLENKLGQEYEPYIFAALNSAKIMLAFGTDYEYYNAVWVKNEWSRFLKLMAKDKSKHLIPCYKNIDAYDMPKEFAKLQAQDMGKVGAIQDLIRGIEKLLPKTKQEEIVVQERVLVDDSGMNKKISSLLDRGYMALEDEDWKKADSFFEEVLNNDSRNYKALVGKALVVEGCCSLDEFIYKCIMQHDYDLASYHPNDFDWIYLEKDNEHIEKAIEKYEIPNYLSKDTIRAKYNFNLKYLSLVFLRKQEYRKEENRWSSNQWLTKVEKYSTGQDVEKLKAAKKKVFDFVEKQIKEAEESAETAKNNLQKEYADFLEKTDKEVEALYSEKLKEKQEDEKRALEEIEEINRKKEEAYQALVSKLDQQLTKTQLEGLKRNFESYGEYRDSKIYVKRCEEKIKTLVDNDKRRKRNRKLLMIFLILFVIIGALTAYYIVIPFCTYQNAISLIEEKKYDEAIRIFTELGDYSDSAKRLKSTKYSYADSLMKDKQYIKAISIYEELNGFNDSLKQIEKAKESLYNMALSYLEVDDYDNALINFWYILDYKDSEYYFNDLLNKSNVMIDSSTISTGFGHAVAITSDFNVIASGLNDDGQCNVGSFKNIRKISAGDRHTVGLKFDGTVVAVGDNYSGQCDVNGWKDIIAISAGGSHTVGLKSDGTVVAVGLNGSGQCDVNKWKDIIAISAGAFHTLGLKADGTVVAVGNNVYGQCDVNEWKDIIAISAGTWHTLGLKADGTVVAVGDNVYGQCDVNEWNDIIAISAGNDHTVGLKSDGTVVAVGMYYSGQCNVDKWKDIIAISAGGLHTIGLKKDGTVVAVGDRDFGALNVDGCKILRLPVLKNQQDNK